MHARLQAYWSIYYFLDALDWMNRIEPSAPSVFVVICVRCLFCNKNDPEPEVTRKFKFLLEKTTINQLFVVISCSTIFSVNFNLIILKYYFHIVKKKYDKFNLCFYTDKRQIIMIHLLIFFIIGQSK